MTVNQMLNDESPSIQPALSATKRALLEKRLRGDSVQSPAAQVAPRRSANSRAPLSFSQQRLWAYIEAHPELSFYLATAVRVGGKLDLDVLNKSFAEVVRRQASLRTAFRVEEGRPVQVVLPVPPPRLPVIDLTDLPAEQQEARIHSMMAEVFQEPFDLSQPPLMRSVALRIHEQEHVLLLVVHHLVADGWSMHVLTREIAVIYEAFSRGEPSPLPELPRQYAEVAAEQRSAAEAFAASLAYWADNLNHSSLVVDLPTDRPRPAAQTFRGAHRSLQLTADVAQSLKSLSRKEGATLYMTTLAAFKALLFHYTGQADLIVGSGIAGRDRADTQDLIGCFFNTLVLRTDLSKDPTFVELLRRVRAVAQEAYAHADVPFEMLRAALPLKPDPSRPPLVQVLFDLREAAGGSLQVEGLTLTALALAEESPRLDLPLCFDLTLGLVNADHGLFCVIKYNVDLFEADTIGRMLERYRILLERVAADPHQRLSRLLTSDDAPGDHGGLPGRR
jgi:Condensation domain